MANRVGMDQVANMVLKWEILGPGATALAALVRLARSAAAAGERTEALGRFVGRSGVNRSAQREVGQIGKGSGRATVAVQGGRVVEVTQRRLVDG